MVAGGQQVVDGVPCGNGGAPAADAVSDTAGPDGPPSVSSTPSPIGTSVTCTPSRQVPPELPSCWVTPSTVTCSTLTRGMITGCGLPTGGDGGLAAPPRMVRRMSRIMDARREIVRTSRTLVPVRVTGVEKGD